MLDSTFHVLGDHPVALPAFLFAAWAVVRFLRARRERVRRVALAVAALAAGPLFAVLLLAEFTRHPLFRAVADAVVAFESAAVGVAVRFVDAAFAAFLRLFLLALGGAWSAVADTVSAAAPALTGYGFLLTAFGFEFLAGAALVYALDRALADSYREGVLTGAGVVMLVSGLFSALVNANAWRLDESVLAAGLLASTLGLTLGVAAVVLLVRPDFGTGSPRSTHGAGSPADAGGDGPRRLLHRAVVRSRAALRDRVGSRDGER